jgi:cell division septation protein DedD
MASLTPLSKGLIGLAVVGGMASAVWHLALKDHLSPPVQTTAPTPDRTPAPQATPEPQPAAAPTPATPTSPTPVATGNQPVTKLSAADNAEQGRQLLERGDFAQARTHLEQAVKDGDGSAACHLGDMTLKGQGGIAANQEQAAKLFQLAQSRSVICFAPGK